MAGREIQKASSAEQRIFYGYVIVVSAFCILVVIFGTRFAFGVFFNPILVEFGWTRAMTSGAFSLSVVMEGLLAIAMGGLTDRIGPRIVLTLCGLFVGLGYLLMSLVGSVVQLYLIYGVLIGIGMGGAIVPLVSTVARWFVGKRGMMTGIVLAGTAFGSFVAPPVANWLISAYDWRISYRILGGIVLIVVVLAAQFLKCDPCSIGRLPYGKKEIGEPESELRTNGFSLREAFHTRQFWLSCAQLVCFGCCFFTIMVHIVPHAIDLGISAASAANILATIGVLIIVGKVVLGSAADRIGNKKTIIIAYILMLAALLWLVPALEVWMLYLFAIVFGLAEGAHAPSQSPLAAGLFGLRSHGLILGFMTFSYTMGGAIGPFLAGHISDVTGRYQMAFLLCAAISIVGLILTTLLKPIKGEHSQNEVCSTT